MPDLARTRADLIAENALLRQQLIILRRQVKRPACTRTDRLLLVVLARATLHWKQALFIIQPDTLAFLASSGIQLVLAAAILGSFQETKNCCRDRCLDPNNGAEQPLVGR